MKTSGYMEVKNVHSVMLISNPIEDDPDMRVESEKWDKDAQFPNKSIWSDEASFTLYGSILTDQPSNNPHVRPDRC